MAQSCADKLHRKRMAYLRGKLLEKRRELLRALANEANREKPPPTPGDEFDVANECSDMETLYGIAQIKSARLEEVEHALTKPADGTYGCCERCDERIPANRLKAMPFASLCIKCKEREERLGRAASQYGDSAWSRVDLASDEGRSLDRIIETMTRTG